jgi:6-phosphogluconolactonase/glucosamine-6-phosphate isomerase/deaminase
MEFDTLSNEGAPKELTRLLDQNRNSRIMLVGGETIQRAMQIVLYQKIAVQDKGVKEIWLADERITNNISLRNASALRRILPPNYFLKESYTSKKPWISQKLFDKWDSKFLKPELLDFAIFTMGSDGHVASILDAPLDKNGMNIQLLRLPTESYWRVSINSEYISKIKEKMLLIQKCRLDKFKMLYESKTFYGDILRYFTKSEIRILP